MKFFIAYKDGSIVAKGAGENLEPNISGSVVKEVSKEDFEIASVIAPVVVEKTQSEKIAANTTIIQKAAFVSVQK